MAPLSAEDQKRLGEFTEFLHELMAKEGKNTFRFVQRVPDRHGPDIVILAAREEEVIPLLDYAQEEKVQGFAEGA